MKLTKFVHSCVLAEDGGKAILFDPGIFSWNSGLVDVAKLPELNAVVVSHQHSDHLGEPFVRALTKQFPDVQWLAAPDSHELLKSYGANNVSDQSTDEIEVIVGDHAHVAPFGVQVQNMVTNWHGVITHPGDTHDFSSPKDILLLPVQAPWATTVRAVELALQYKPKYVLPIHDWMWNEEWRQNCYNRFEQILNDTNTKFLWPVDGQPIDLTL